ncbi:MAG: hypothetical protein LQ342_004698 [Letrouitia transgressa]|nr:MAG: hypothetical protein LQ342_004698 [Letrouitia transgressa]
MSEPSPEQSSPSKSPAASRPRREGNDSLWKRARRTLGTNSLTFLQPQGRSVTGMTDDGSGSGAGKTGPGKRREQVRHAQRTHRQRTQNYIKTLESEVVRLRGTESTLMRDKSKLQNQVDLLRTTLILSNVPLPAGFEESSPPPVHSGASELDMLATVTYKTDNSDHKRLHVDWPAQLAAQPATNIAADAGPSGGPPQQGLGASGFKPLPNLPNEFSLSPLNFSSTYENPLPGTASRNLDTAEVAVDFVLALEHPCMAHIPHPADAPTNDPSNHMLLISTPLMSRAPDPPQPNESRSWTANASIIKELLNLSSSINLEGEITPVEAWHQLRQHPEFSKLDKWGLEKLKADLSASVRCCG